MNFPTANELKEYLNKTKRDKMADIQQSKAWYLSKTIWTNFILGVVVLAVPGAKEIVNEEILFAAFSLINIVLRAVSKDKIQIK